MKKVLLSIGVGCVMTWLLYVYAKHPRPGPTPIVEYILLPLYLLLCSISPDGALGELVGWVVTVLIMSLVSYLALSLLWVLLRGRRRE